MKRSFETIHVGEIMTRSPVSVRADDSLQRALDLIEKHQVHELPVLLSACPDTPPALKGGLIIRLTSN